jgi:lipopolysaccharide heptosyltransferase II
MNKINLLKFLDRLIGTPLTFLAYRENRIQKYPHPPGKILLIRPGGIGDAVLLLPSIQMLKSAFPDARIDVLCEKRNAGIFGLSEKAGEVYLYDRDFELFKCLHNDYDIVIDTEQWHRLSAVIAYLTKAPARIGFDTNERRKLFTHKIPYSHDDYEAYSFLRLIEPLTGSSPGFRVDAPFTTMEKPFPSHLLPQLKKGRDIIALFPGASVVERRWGGENFGQVAKILHEDGKEIVILGSQDDRADADEIKKYAGGSIDLTGKTSLIDVASILKHCSLLITADSGMMHIAVAVGTPTVSLFGSGIQNKWGPRGKKHIVLNHQVVCSPCTRFGYTPQCRNNVKCLSSIRADEVITAAEKLLDKKDDRVPLTIF